MAAYYLDASAIVKRYASEVGTAWISALTARGARNVLYTVQVTGPEVVAALARKVRTGDLLVAASARAQRNFRLDWHDQYEIVAMTDDLVLLAMDLASNHGLRGYDAVHSASALQVHTDRQASRLAPLTFISADLEQLQAATAEGLVVDDPNSHS